MVIQTAAALAAGLLLSLIYFPAMAFLIAKAARYGALTGETNFVRDTINAARQNSRPGRKEDCREKS